MIKVSELMRIRVYLPKKGASGNPKELLEKDLQELGIVHQVAFAPKGNRVVGMLVKRPLMVTDNTVLVGFREAEWENELK